MSNILKLGMLAALALTFANGGNGAEPESQPLEPIPANQEAGNGGVSGPEHANCDGNCSTVSACCCSSCKPFTPPCICPYQEVNLGPGLYAYHCYRYEDECGCNNGSCQDPVDGFFATSTNLAYPQDCDDPGMPCEFSSVMADRPGMANTHKGLSAALDPGFTPTFDDLALQSITPTPVYTKVITFEGQRRLITAKVFVYHIPDYVSVPEPVDPTDPDVGLRVPAHTMVFGVEIKPGTTTPTYHVDRRFVSMDIDLSRFVYYVNTGGLIFPVVIKE